MCRTKAGAVKRAKVARGGLGLRQRLQAAVVKWCDRLDHLKQVVRVLLGFRHEGRVERLAGVVREIVGKLVDCRLLVRVEVGLLELPVQAPVGGHVEVEERLQYLTGYVRDVVAAEDRPVRLEGLQHFEQVVVFGRVVDE